MIVAQLGGHDLDRLIDSLRHQERFELVDLMSFLTIEMVGARPWGGNDPKELITADYGHLIPADRRIWPCCERRPLLGAWLPMVTLTMNFGCVALLSCDNTCGMEVDYDALGRSYQELRT